MEENLFFLPRIDPRTPSLTALSITQCFNLSFCLLLPTCLCLSTYIFSHICFVPGQLYSLLLTIVRASSMSSVDRNCFNCCFNFICHFSEFTSNGHVTSHNLTIFYNFSCVLFIKCVFTLICLLIYHVTDRNA